MQSDVRQKIAAAVRAEMARDNVTQQELAGKLGRNQPWLSLRLTGRVSFQAEELVHVAHLLGVPVSTFLPDTARAA